MLAAMTDVFAGFGRTDCDGIPVLWNRDPRFKTFRLSLSARRRLDERAAAGALLPDLLLQGTAVDRDLPALARRMEMLYGAAVAPSCQKSGETQILRFALDCVAGDFLPGKPDQLGDGLEFLAEQMLQPKVRDGAFDAGDFALERTQALNDARAVFDDKAAWSVQRAMELACAGEPMAIPAHGGVAAIEALRPEDPESSRIDFLTHGQLVLVAMGALPEAAQLQEVLEGWLAQLPARRPREIPASTHPVSRGRRSATERAELQQAKLVMVYRLPPSDDPQVWMGRALFASMLGGGPHSRLFREVREKQSLCYYCQATLERHKGLLLIRVGLDESAAEKVEAETSRQIAELAAGKFNDEELQTAKAGILSTITAMTDSVRSHMQFVEEQWVLGLDRTPQDLFQAYLAAGPEPVQAAAGDCELDFVYLLGGAEG